MKENLKQSLSVAGLFAVTFFWGSTFVLVKQTIAVFDLYYFLFLRFLLAFLILALFFYRRLFSVKAGTILASFILSLLLCSVYISQTEGLRYTSASNSALITGLYIVLVPIFSIICFRIRSRRSSYFGALLALIGLYLLTQYSWTGFNSGDGLTLICAAGCAWHIILTGKYTKKHDAASLVIFQFLFTAVFLAVFSLGRGSVTLHIPKIAIIAIVITAVFATAIAFIVQTVAQRYVDATRTGIIFAMEAPFGVLFAWRLGNESLTTISFIGACVMVMGMVVSEAYPFIKKLL
ncbi:MAG: DMT family transporter [Deltaproteobacteria bacterium]|nr:DMT family transporter [Deltaproteobacteria bacterium]